MPDDLVEFNDANSKKHNLPSWQFVWEGVGGGGGGGGARLEAAKHALSPILLATRSRARHTKPPAVQTTKI